MKTLLPTLLAFALIFSAAEMRAADRDAEDLIAKMLESQNVRGAVVRAKLTIEDDSSDHKSSAQIRIRMRRDAEMTRMLFQVLWPDTHKGEAVCIERGARGVTGGFIFQPPDKVTPLTAANMSRTYLDSDLTIEDLADEFWHWPSQKITGEETIRGDVCKIVESRLPGGTKSGYSLVRSWISPEKLLPMRMDKFGRDERLAKRVTVQKTTRHDGIWAPMTTFVQSAGKTRVTTLEISRGERDVEIPVEEFSLQRIRKP